MTLAIATGIHLVQFCVLRQAVIVPVGLPEFNYRSQTCSPRPLLHVGSSSVAARSSFTALDWLSTSFSRIPSFSPPGVDYAGPSALLEGDSKSTSCFSFLGGQGGAVLISDSERYRISGFTLDNLILDPEAGLPYYPKEGALWGLFEGTLPSELQNATTSFVAERATYVLIGSFCLDPKMGSVQTFAIDDTIVAIPTMIFSVFYLEISSNWGGTHTCVCRLRLHGSAPV